MNEPIVILDSRGFHVRAGGTWHHGLSREQSRRLLLDAGIDTHDTCLLLESPVWWPDPAEVEYRPTGRRHWLVDGVPVTKEGAAWIFRRVGLTHDETRHLMRIHQLAYEIEQRLPPPPTDSMTVAEFCHLLAAELAHALSISGCGTMGARTPTPRPAQTPTWPCRLERAIRAGQAETPHHARGVRPSARRRQDQGDRRCRVCG